MLTKYVDPKGRLIFVSRGLGIVNPKWMTMYKDAGKWDKPGMHRLKSKDLPERDTEVEAQADLDAYATEQKGWVAKVNCSFSSCPFHACMSDDCQLEHVIENVPHIVLEYGPRILAGVKCQNHFKLKEAVASLKKQ